VAGTGLASWINVKKEATPGTLEPSPAQYYRIPFTSESLTKSYTRGVSNNITATRVRGGVYTLGQSCGGSISGNMTWEALDWLLLGAMGTVSTPALSGTAATNTYTFAAWSSAFPSFSIEVNRGDIPTNDKVFSYYGCYVSELTMNFPADGDINFSASIVAKDETSTAVNGNTAQCATPTALSTDCISRTQLKTSTLDIGVGAADAYCVKSAMVKISAPYEQNMPCLGATISRLPLPNGLVDVTGEFVVEFADRLAYDAFAAQTPQSGGRICFEGGLIAGGGAAEKYTLDLRINKFLYDAPSVAFTDGPGVMYATIPWTAYGVGGTTLTTEPIAVQTINTVEGDAVL
jgi:hypothetical protein